MCVSSILLVTSPNNGGGVGSEKSLKCWLRRKSDQHGFFFFCFSHTFAFFFAAFLLIGTIVAIYVWLFFTPYVSKFSYIGCEEDNEGSWSIDVFNGDSPFSLRPIEDENLWRNESAAWPVANP